MSTASSLLDDFESWVARGTKAAAAMDMGALEACTSELESFAGSLRELEGDEGRETLERVRAGVTRWREMCLIATQALEEVVAAGPGGTSTASYRHDGALARAAAQGRLVRSWG